MKRLLIVLIACFAIVAFSCKDNAFNFSNFQNMDKEGNWGIPAANLQYTIEDILNKSTYVPLNINSDGMLQLEYETEVDSIVSSDQILQAFANRTFTVKDSKSIPLVSAPTPAGITFNLFSDTRAIELPQDKVMIELARIKSGTFTFSLSQNLPIDMTAELTCPQLTDANGQTFNQTITFKETNKEISLAGYTLKPKANGQLSFSLRFSLVTTGGHLPDEAKLSYDITLKDLVLEEFQGKIAPISLNIDRSINLKLDYLNKTMGGNFTVYNPDIRCEVYNMFPIAANITLNEAALHGPNVQPASLISKTPASLIIPASTSNFAQVALPICSSLTFNPKMDKARVTADITLNPDGFKTPTMVIREGEFIHFRFSFKLPLHFKTNNVTFCDTLNFNKTEFPEIEGVHNMVIRCLFKNGLPIDLFSQVYFYDSKADVIRDSLFSQRHLLVGSYNNQPSTSEAFITRDNFNAIRGVINCDKIILNATLFTDNHQVIINNEQKLRVLIGANFNLDLVEFSHNHFLEDLKD